MTLDRSCFRYDCADRDIVFMAGQARNDLKIEGQACECRPVHVLEQAIIEALTIAEAVPFEVEHNPGDNNEVGVPSLDFLASAYRRLPGAERAGNEIARVFDERQAELPATPAERKGDRPSVV